MFSTIDNCYNHYSKILKLSNFLSRLSYRKNLTYIERKSSTGSRDVSCMPEILLCSSQCRGGLLVKASGFHPDNPGLIPGAAKISPRKLVPTSSGRSAHPRTDILAGYGAGLAGDGWRVSG